MKRKVTDEEMLSRKFDWLQPKEIIAKRTSIGRKCIWWKCLCDCGRFVERRESSLVNGLTQSCGCQHRESCGLGEKSPNWKGCGELSGYYFSSIRARSVKVGREFAITIEYLWNLFLKQDRKCKLSKIKLTFATNQQRRNGLATQTASLDRIDSTKGYIEGNVQWVHKDIQLMKNYFPQEHFIEMCRLVFENYAISNSKVPLTVAQ